MYASEQTAFKSVVVEDEAQSEGEELEEAFFKAGKHIPETASLYLWLDRQTLPYQKMSDGLMRLLAKF